MRKVLLLEMCLESPEPNAIPLNAIKSMSYLNPTECGERRCTRNLPRQNAVNIDMEDCSAYRISDIYS